MYPGDDVSKWPATALTDPRVEHRWDEPKAAGRWFLANLQSLQPSRGGDGVFPQRVDALWDSYLMFGRDATWNDAPSSVLSWGYTMMRTKGQLLKDFEFAINRRWSSTLPAAGVQGGVDLSLRRSSMPRSSRTALRAVRRDARVARGMGTVEL